MELVLTTTGDAHDAEGFCNAIKKAKVQGEIRG
jgi:hypothetical protein